jgi:hypothetical protein
MLYRIAIVCIILFGYSCKDKDKKFDQQNYEESKQNLTVKEKESPLQFLSLDSKTHKNLFGKTVIKGSVLNKATAVTYKNIRIKLLFYDKTGKEVRHHEDEFDETVKPGQSMNFKSRFRVPKESDSCAVSIMSAKIVE